MSALGSASLKNAIANFLGHGLGDFGAQIGDFADQMNTAADAVAGISDPGLDNLKAIADIGQLFGELQSTIKPTGGILAGIATYDIGDFGWDIGTYARNLNQAASFVAQISTDGLANLGKIADIGTAFSELQSTLDPTDGIVTWLDGHKDIGDFGEEISTYASNLNTAASAVAELSDDGITNLGVVANIGDAFADLQKSVGDAIDLFDVLDGATLDGFGEKVKTYAENVKKASDAVSRR